MASGRRSQSPLSPPPWSVVPHPDGGRPDGPPGSGRVRRARLSFGGNRTARSSCARTTFAVSRVGGLAVQPRMLVGTGMLVVVMGRSVLDVDVDVDEDEDVDVEVDEEVEVDDEEVGAGPFSDPAT